MTDKALELGTYEEVRDGVPLKYKITSIPSYLMEDVVEHMTVHFFPREPMCSSHKLHEDPASIKGAQNMWRKQIAGGAALVALKEGPGEEKDRIIGANITYITSRGDSAYPEVMRGTKMEIVYESVVEIGNRANIFDKYGVDKYMTAFGLSVDSNYHGYKIGKHLLECRKPMCEAIGVKVTGTVFTQPTSQYLAKKVGFVVLYEEDYSKFTYKGEVVFKMLTGKFEQTAWSFQ